MFPIFFQLSHLKTITKDYILINWLHTLPKPNQIHITQNSFRGAHLNFIISKIKILLRKYIYCIYK